MKIRIEYCQMCDYEPDALRARDRLIATGKVSKEDIDLFGERIGALEITIDGDLKYSKLTTNRFPEQAELDGMV